MPHSFMLMVGLVFVVIAAVSILSYRLGQKRPRPVAVKQITWTPEAVQLICDAIQRGKMKIRCAASNPSTQAWEKNPASAQSPVAPPAASV